MRLCYIKRDEIVVLASPWEHSASRWLPIRKPSQTSSIRRKHDFVRRRSSQKFWTCKQLTAPDPKHFSTNIGSLFWTVYPLWRFRAEKSNILKEPNEWSQVFLRGPIKGAKLLGFWNKMRITAGLLHLCMADNWIKRDLTTLISLLLTYLFQIPTVTFDYWTGDKS